MAQQEVVSQRKAWWLSIVAAVIGLVVFVAIVIGLEIALKPSPAGTGMLLIGVILALIPAILWLVVFYAQDRLEPEPKSEVVKIFFIGLALAAAIGIPLTDQIFNVPGWINRGAVAMVLGSIFVIGAVEAFIVYAAVRFFIYDSSEFDERTDGMVYGTAAGLGYATALNIQFILSSGGAAFGTATVYMVEAALAHAAFAGVLGYFLGRAKLERERIWWLPLGLLLSTLLNGIFNILRNQLEVGSITIGAGSPVPALWGLILAGALAIVVALVVAFLIHRDIALTKSNKLPSAALDAAVGDRRSNWAVVATFVVLMIVGIVSTLAITNQTTAFSTAGFQGAYPADFGREKEDKLTAPVVFQVTDILGTGAQFIIQKRTIEGEAADAKRIVNDLAGERATEFDVYQVWDRGEATVGGKPALTQRFAYVDARVSTGQIPQVVEGMDYIVTEGNQAAVITLLANPDDMPAVEPLFLRFVSSLSISF